LPPDTATEFSILGKPMITFSQMVARLIVAMILGGVIGFERENVGKEVGIRTAMTVSAGAAIFSIIAIMVPYLMSDSPENALKMAMGNGGYLGIIANIVVGIGFLGAGIIIKNEDRVHGLTSAAVVWTTAAVGVLAGLGMFEFAIASSLIIAVSLFALRKFNVAEKVRTENHGY
jgi:putative Mg2+ transporter-C (MgtC) family protein